MVDVFVLLAGFAVAMAGVAAGPVACSSRSGRRPAAWPAFGSSPAWRD